MITLYHGSNMTFSVPDLSAGRQIITLTPDIPLCMDMWLMTG